MPMHHHDDGRAVAVYAADKLLFRYVYHPTVPPEESPRPYWHPLNTLAGYTLTDFQPADHRWHHGLSLAIPYLNGANFWGGPSYVTGQGYTWLANHGRTQHREWEPIVSQPDQCLMVERLDWISPAGERWLNERRTIRAALESDQQWSLHLTFELTNISQTEVVWGSPRSQGPDAPGYGGLFWRGAESLRQGEVFTEARRGETALMGQSAPWLNYQTSAGSLLFRDAPENLRHPTPWFVRQAMYVGVCAAFLFHQPYALPAGDTLRLNYSITIDDPLPDNRSQRSST